MNGGGVLQVVVNFLVDPRPIPLQDVSYRLGRNPCAFTCHGLGPAGPHPSKQQIDQVSRLLVLGGISQVRYAHMRAND